MFARGVVTIESVLKICCPNVNFIDIFASYMLNFNVWKLALL